MSWPSADVAPLSRLRVATQVVVLVRDEVTGEPPAVSPTMRLQRVDGLAVTDLDWTARLTISGAVVFAGFDRVSGSGAAVAEDYLLLVASDGVFRADHPAGYAFTVPPDSGQWPVEVRVRLLPGPAYPYLRHLPVVRGRVLRSGAPVPDAIVALTENNGAVVSARCAADHLGRFSVRAQRYRPTRAMEIRATAPGGVSSPSRVLVSDDFVQSVDLIVP